MQDQDDQQETELHEEVVPSPHINRMTRPPYRPPDKGMRRDGSEDYLKWPSKGGD